MKGFNAAADVPTLLPDNTSNINASGTYSDGNMMEAKSMTGKTTKYYCYLLDCAYTLIRCYILLYIGTDESV